jgi:hypothetical protein
MEPSFLMQLQQALGAGQGAGANFPMMTQGMFGAQDPAAQFALTPPGGQAISAFPTQAPMSEYDLGGRGAQLPNAMGPAIGPMDEYDLGGMGSQVPNAAGLLEEPAPQADPNAAMYRRLGAVAKGAQGQEHRAAMLAPPAVGGGGKGFDVTPFLRKGIRPVPGQR